MSINDDIAWYYSGDGTASGSLGGAITVNAITTSVNENLHANIPVSEADIGSNKYRCVYLKNDGTASYDVGIYLSTVTPSTDTKIYFGIGTSGVNGTEQTIADEDTEPTGVLFVHREFDYSALPVGTLTPGDYIAVWIRRDVSAGAGGKEKDYCRFKLREV